MLLETRGDYEFANSVREMAHALERLSQKPKKAMRQHAQSEESKCAADTINAIIKDGGHIDSVCPLSEGWVLILYSTEEVEE